MLLMASSLTMKRFSAAGKTVPASTGLKDLIKGQQKYQPVMLISEYGDLLNVKPMTKLKPAKSSLSTKEDLRQVFMLNNQSDVKSLLKKMHHHPKAFFLFSPEGHYVNAMALYSAMKRLLDEKYYGTGKPAKKTMTLPDEGLEIGSKSAEKAMKDAQPVSFKGTPFHSCQIPYDVFHMQRRTKLTIKQQLSRMGFLMLRDGSLEVQGDAKPEIKDVEEILLEMSNQFEISSTYKKPDFFVPMTVVEGLASSANMLKRGIQIHCLQSRLIYPLYGVWTPTTQEYLSLLSNYVS